MKVLRGEVIYGFTKIVEVTANMSDGTHYENLSKLKTYFQHSTKRRRQYVRTIWPVTGDVPSWLLYILFTHQYLWNKSVPGSNTSRILPMGVPKGWCLSAETGYNGWSTENIAMLCVAITLNTLQNVVHAGVRRLRQCLNADGGHFEHLHWIQNSRTSLISILLLYKYSSYDYRVIFFMSNCVYILLGHSVYTYKEAEKLKIWIL
jgi:hypothetical protein